MAVIRLILLVAILGGLTLLLAQNWLPVLSLVFLGMKSQPLPLAIWILFSTAAGAFTTVFISGLFNLSNYFAAQQRRTPLKSPATSPRTNQSREEPTPRPSNPPPSDSKTDSTSDASDDWERGSSVDDWDFEEKQENTQVRDNTEERQPEPKSSSKSGSVYSYNYRESSNSGVGKTESIYDADYRVIIPPYQQPTTNQAKDDDWEFFDEDNSKDENEPRR